MEDKQRHDLLISGVGSASGGNFDNVTVQGVGKVHGDITCNRCSIEGVADVNGNVKAATVRVQGKARIKGDVTGTDVKIEGHCSITGNCSSDKFYVSGAFSVDGLINADEVSVKLEGSAEAREIGGESIRVKGPMKLGLFQRLKRLTVDTIEGDDVYLEYTKAKVVRGNKVYVGAGCDIDLVEYRTDFSMASGAKVSEHKQV